MYGRISIGYISGGEIRSVSSIRLLACTVGLVSVSTGGWSSGLENLIYLANGGDVYYSDY